MMNRQTSVLLALAALTLATIAHADTLRCGSKLVAEGATQTEVREKCGAPTSARDVTEPVYARRPDGFTYQTGTATKTLWTYDRGSRQFPAVLTFEGGVLKKLEFIK
jgi:hypothetical protein